MIAAPRVLVVGMGEVGRRLAGALAAAGVEVVPVGHDTGWERVRADDTGLLLVCVREEALAEVVARLRGTAPERLVFVQNGWVRPLIEGFPGCNRGLVWFTSKGEFFRVLRPSVFTGPAAAFLAESLACGSIAAQALPDGEFAAREAEKMGFNCVVGLPLAVHRLSLAEYLERHAEEAEALFAESVGVTAAALGTSSSPAWWAAFLRAAEPLGWVRVASAKALEFRNGAVVRLAHGLGLAAPVNQRLLAAAGHQP